MQQLGAERPRQGAPAGEGTLVVGSRYGTLWLLQAATGAVLWQHVSGEKLGSLIHTGAVIYVPSYLGLPIRKPADRLPPTPPPAAEEGPRRQPPSAHPSYLTALRVRDGTVLWRREGWKPPGSENPPLARAGDVLITDALAREIGERQITALDRRTGETRWACAAGEPSGYARRLLGVRGGRVYVSKGGLEHYRLHVLDARSGEELWTLDQVQWWVTVLQNLPIYPEG
jgi:outer membrane protein assembly factor BamB